MNEKEMQELCVEITTLMRTKTKNITETLGILEIVKHTFLVIHRLDGLKMLLEEYKEGKNEM